MSPAVLLEFILSAREPFALLLVQGFAGFTEHEDLLYRLPAVLAGMIVWEAVAGDIYVGVHCGLLASEVDHTPVIYQLQHLFSCAMMQAMRKLAKVRKSRKLSQTALAAMLGTSQAAVCKWEKGVNKPHPSTLRRIVAALNCREAELV
jgi:DNA-binding XRE family transcriptional regulator